MGGHYEVVEAVRRDYQSAPVSPKLKTLLAIAGKVQQSGKQVTEHDVERARREGATDREIHDAILIAAAFSMFNRYVDGLAMLTPIDGQSCDAMGSGWQRKAMSPPAAKGAALSPPDVENCHQPGIGHDQIASARARAKGSKIWDP